MPKFSMSRLSRHARSTAAIGLLAILTACGGSGAPTADSPAPAPSPSPSPTPAPPPPAIVGVATPDSVAVVTATNAN
jgi:hypothetical protein